MLCMFSCCFLIPFFSWRQKYNLFPDNLSQTLMYKMLRLISVVCLWKHISLMLSYVVFFYFYFILFPLPIKRTFCLNNNNKKGYFYLFIYLMQCNSDWKLNYKAIERKTLLEKLCLGHKGRKTLIIFLYFLIKTNPV